MANAMQYRLRSAILLTLSLSFAAMQAWLSACRTGDNIAANYHPAYGGGVKQAELDFYQGDCRVPETELQSYGMLAADNSSPPVALLLMGQWGIAAIFAILFRQYNQCKSIKAGVIQAGVKLFLLTTFFYFLIAQKTQLSKVQESGEQWGLLTGYAALCASDNMNAVCTQPAVLNMGNVTDVDQNDHLPGSPFKDFHGPFITVLFGLSELGLNTLLYFLNASLFMTKYAQWYNSPALSHHAADNSEQPLNGPVIIVRHPESGETMLGVPEQLESQLILSARTTPASADQNPVAIIVGPAHLSSDSPATPLLASPDIA